jgi:signal transduction histidine kinase
MSDHLDVLPDAVVLIGPDGRIVRVNTMAARLLGRSAGELHGADAAGAVALTDETGAEWWSCTQPLSADAALLPRVPETDLLLTDATGRVRPVTLTAARVADGEVRLVLSLRRAEGRRRLDAARSDLVSTVSHEIRSPLTSVKGFTKTLLAKWDRFTDEQKKTMLATVNEDADRVTRLLGELLDVSRIDAGRVQLRRQMIDPAAIARRVVERAAINAEDRLVTAEIGDELPSLYADPDKVEQVLTNLVENALKYSDGPVRLRTAVTPEEVTFTVEDEGPGIPAAHLTHVFVKFFRKPGERRTGTGLGLYISKGLVESHGGRIWVTSEEGKGAAFHFTLPQGGLELAGIGT